MDVDKMFKLPSLPTKAGQKRRMPDAPAPGKSLLSIAMYECIADHTELLKKYRPTVEDEEPAPGPQSNGKGKGKAVEVADEDEEMSYAGRTSPATLCLISFLGNC